jgi:DNA-binding response OmpR family regulator
MDTCDLIRTLLPDFTVDIASSREAATDLFEAGDYDFMIIDEHLLDGSGMQLCKQFRDSGNRAGVVIISGDPQIRSVDVARAGGQMLLSKSSRGFVEDLQWAAKHFALDGY